MHLVKYLNRNTDETYYLTIRAEEHEKRHEARKYERKGFVWQSITRKGD